MLIPVGEDVAVPVGVVVLRGEPEIWTAVLVRLDTDTLRLRVTTAGARPPEVGVRLIVHAERIKLPGKVLAVEDGHVVVSRDRAHATDDRAAPRVMSHLALRWRVADLGVSAGDRAGGPDRAMTWLAGGADPGPFVSFRGGASVSMSGMRFDAKGVAPPAECRLLIELSLGGGQWRALGAVRRLDAGGSPEAVAVVVEFLELPESTFDALSDFTLRNL